MLKCSTNYIISIDSRHQHQRCRHVGSEKVLNRWKSQKICIYWQLQLCERSDNWLLGRILRTSNTGNSSWRLAWPTNSKWQYLSAWLNDQPSSSRITFCSVKNYRWRCFLNNSPPSQPENSCFIKHTADSAFLAYRGVSITSFPLVNNPTILRLLRTMGTGELDNYTWVNCCSVHIGLARLWSKLWTNYYLVSTLDMLSTWGDGM